MRERERLIARIRQMRRASGPTEEATKAPAGGPEQDRMDVLEGRITHLEALLQGLQDSVHRESTRHAQRITELEARVQPGALGRALSDDVRARGL
jgi:uncharacterized coiled-coil protein SlyX